MRFSKPSREPQKPPVKPVRIKTYAAQSGFVYQYYFDGEHDGGAARHYTFHASSSRAEYLPVVVELPHGVKKQWQFDRKRELSPTECYAVAKMTLFAAFDDDRFVLPRMEALILTGGAIDDIAAILNLL